MITKLNLTKDMINFQESDFYEGKINPRLHEDVAVVYTNQRLRKLFKYEDCEIPISRPSGLWFALRYLYDDNNINQPNKMRVYISIPILNSVISVVETKIKDKYRYVATEGKYKELVI